MDRMIRGAYEGRLFPGRTTSRITSETRAPPSPLRHPASTPDDLFTILETPLVRIHSECYTGETAWSARCDCGEQLDEAARLMSQDPAGGVVVYLRQEGRGIGLGEKLKAYNLQDLGNDTVQANLILRHPADARSYGLATAILKDLECTNIRLLTNNPDKIAAVEGPNKEVKVVRRVGMVPKMWRGVEGGVAGKEVSEYLRTKVGFPYPISSRSHPNCPLDHKDGSSPRRVLHPRRESCHHRKRISVDWIIILRQEVCRKQF